MQKRRHKLVVVQRPVESNRQPVRHGSVPYVQSRLPYGGEQIISGGGMATASLLVDGVGVDEGDGEATCGEVDGQMDGGDDVALERVGDENYVGLLVL